MTKRVKLVEVGLRDGLQNEKQLVGLTTRKKLIQLLINSGMKDLEIGAFVSPDKVPQMAYSKELIKHTLLNQKRGKVPLDIEFSALVPNQKGFEQALKSGVQKISVLTATSDLFSIRNINCNVKESLKRIKEIIDLNKPYKIPVRGYLSTSFGCPYEGIIKESKVVKMAEELLDMGVNEVSISDTIGVANPKNVESLLKKLLKKIDQKFLALHFHDTRGLALTNIYISLNLGITTFDASIGGLGGCPYAMGASGNVATEDVVFLLHSLGVKTGIDLKKLLKTSNWLQKQFQHPLNSRVSSAGLWKF